MAFVMLPLTETSPLSFVRRNSFGIGFSLLAAGLGFEPRLMDPETIVLPLDDPAILYFQMLVQNQKSGNNANNSYKSYLN